MKKILILIILIGYGLNLIGQKVELCELLTDKAGKLNLEAIRKNSPKYYQGAAYFKEFIGGVPVGQNNRGQIPYLGTKIFQELVCPELKEQLIKKYPKAEIKKIEENPGHICVMLPNLVRAAGEKLSKTKGIGKLLQSVANNFANLLKTDSFQKVCTAIVKGKIQPLTPEEVAKDDVKLEETITNIQEVIQEAEEETRQEVAQETGTVPTAPEIDAALGDLILGKTKPATPITPKKPSAKKETKTASDDNLLRDLAKALAIRRGQLEPEEK